MAKKKAVSLSPDDAVSGGGFQGGTTTIKKMRFWKGYGVDHNTPEIITLALTHTPKSSGETEMDCLSCGKSAAKNFTIGPKGKTLLPKSGATGLQSGCNTMIFLMSMVEAGFPKARLAGGDVSKADGITVKCKQKPIDRSGLDDGQPRTSLVVTKLVKTPFDSDAGDEDEDDADQTDEAGEDDDDDEEEDEEEDEEDDEDDEEEDDEEGEVEDESDDDEEDEEEDEEPPPPKKTAKKKAPRAPSDATVGKHLKAVVKAAGGKIKRTKLTPKGFAVLKGVTGRNEIMTRMVEVEFLEIGKGWTFTKKTGQITVP